MAAAEPVFLSTLRAGGPAFGARHPEIVRDADGARILRSVLMKPESEQHVEEVPAAVEGLV
jgi:hypothetical protein